MLRMKISSACVAGVLTIGQAFAAPTTGPARPQTSASVSNQAPLPPAGAASIREAQGVGRPLLYWAGAGAVIIAGVILIAGPQDDDDTSTTTTTGN
jgi:hypothetical protein